MIDDFALAISHLLLALAFWRLAMRDDVDRDPPATAEDSGDATGA
jgi:hypothetical protein